MRRAVPPKLTAHSASFLGNELVEQHTHILGPEKLFYVVEDARGEEEHRFYVEGLAFPDADFSGLVSFHATMLDTSHKVQ